MNRAYKIILSLVIISCSILCMPFSYINAESQVLAPPFLGVNINVIDVVNNTRYVMRGSPEIENTNQMAWYCTARTSTGCDAWVTREPNGSTAYHNYEISFNGAYLNPTILDTNYIVELEFIFDNNYVGQFQLEYNNTKTGLEDQFVFVNGSSVSIKLDNFDISNPSISVYGINLKNNKNLMFQFPIESYNFIYSFIEYGYNMTSIDSLGNSFYFPIFNMNANSPIYRRYLYKGEKVQIVYATNKALSTTDFSLSSSNYTDLVVTSINRSTRVNNSNWMGVYRLNFECTATSTQQVKLITDVDKFIPIYANVIGNSNGLYDMPVSTDFALEFMIQNKLLNDINIIAQGNNQSQSSVNSATTTNQQAQSTFEQEEQLVNQAETQMQQNLDNLDIQNKNNNLFSNSKFIASAQWVKTQFDWFTNNNAFGYLITFSLVIGLALVIVGKLRG